MKNLMQTTAKCQEQEKMAKQSTNNRNQNDPYEPDFMYQSMSSDAGVGPKKKKGFQMSFKRETKAWLQIPQMKSQNGAKKTS